MDEERVEGDKGTDKAADNEIKDDELVKLLEDAKDPLPSADVPAELPKPIVAERVSNVTNQVVENKADELDLRNTFRKFNQITDKILDNFDDDRDEIEETINSLKDLFTSTAKPQEHIVMGLVSAIRTKTDANTNIIKLLDSISRLVASTKNTNIFQSSETNIDLSALLEEPGKQDEGSAKSA